MEFDYIICGGGASGLSIASGLSLDQYFTNKKILIIDPEFPKKKNDRTWCFWENDKSDWDDLTHYKWEKVIFNSPQINKTISLDPLRYKMLKSMSYYKKSNDLILKNPNIQYLNDKVLKVDDKGNFCEVKTENKLYKSKKVFNSILNWELLKNNSKYPLLIQHFEGWVIKTKNNFFDPEKATFMDFTIDQNSTTQFMYILPFSKTEALVEYTLFSKNLLDENKYKSSIENYLLKSGIDDFEIKSKESGQIPMTCFPFFEANTKNILNIGSAGGWSKPSTGYTFKNIDKNTSKIIDFLKSNDNFKTFMKKNRFWFYDLIFLDVLYYKNHLGKQLFTDMFNKNNPKTIFKFLDNKSSFIEELKIMLSFPKTIFLSAVLKRICKGL